MDETKVRFRRRVDVVGREIGGDILTESGEFIAAIYFTCGWLACAKGIDRHSACFNILEENQLFLDYGDGKQTSFFDSLDELIKTMRKKWGYVVSNPEDLPDTLET